MFDHFLISRLSPKAEPVNNHQGFFFFFFSQADVSWSINGVPKGIIKQSLGNVPIMVKSKLCNLHGLSPKELIEHHEEAEVKPRITELCVTRH